MRRPNGHHELVAVNADRRESDFDVIPPETLALWQNTGQGVGRASARPPSAEAGGFLVVRDDGGAGAGGRGIVVGQPALGGGERGRRICAGNRRRRDFGRRRGASRVDR